MSTIHHSSQTHNPREHIAQATLIHNINLCLRVDQIFWDPRTVSFSPVETGFPGLIMLIETLVILDIEKKLYLITVLYYIFKL